MDERTLQWRVGIVVICAALILAIMIFLFGEGWQSQYTLFIKTRTAPNVMRNTPVHKNGILIGRVSAVENQDDGVLLTLRINSDEPIYQNEICTIGTASFLGDAVLDFSPGNLPTRGAQVADRTLFDNVIVERNPIELIDVALNLEEQVAETLNSISEAGQGVSELTRSVQEILGGDEGDVKAFMDDIRKVAGKAELALDNVNEFMVNINDVVGDPEARDNMRITINRLPQILNDVNATINDTRETINGFRTIADSANRNLTNLEEFTALLGNEGPAMMDSLNSSLKKIDMLVTNLGNFTQNITESEGTLGKLVNDPELYNYLTETMRNVRDLTIRLQPLINDVRFAVDGIARDPGQLGIRGALDRRPAFGRYKGTLTGSDWQDR